MFGNVFYYNALLMGSLTLFFHHIFRNLDIEKHPFEKYSVNFMRSLVCGTFANEALVNYKYIWNNKCLDNCIINNKFQEYHSMFLSYFVFDTIILLYQVYMRLEKYIRFDLLFHHILAITTLLIIDYNKMYGITLMIGLTEGMSIVTGPKLLSIYYNNKTLTNIFIKYRMYYLIFIRMLFIWPSLLYYYHNITLQCDLYKDKRNMFLVFSLIGIILQMEIRWLNNGKYELRKK